MKIIVVTGASHYSRGKGRNRKEFAQVTFLTGEGSARRSNTAHPELRPGIGFIGFNPDQRAIPLNERYEAELAEAKGKFASAEATVKSIEKKLEEISKAPEGDILAESMLLATHVLLEEQLEIAQDGVTNAMALVDDAGVKLDIVRRELPLEVKFVGPGLTY